MAILKLRPACKDYLWGGQRLKKEFGVDMMDRCWLRHGCFPAIPMDLRQSRTVLMQERH
jgi:hypothetical protein